ncbi:hypothetical protein [Chamaesiphon sp.]|uniref:hypothetical protein n=1 Tax=Chamaesiphon sp. TaxID=2814140 RepID=UPI003592E880
MANSKRQAIGNHLTAVWKKFQHRHSSRAARESDVDVPPSQIEIDEDLTYDGYPQPDPICNNVVTSTLTKLTDDGLFRDAIAPMSKLNLPRLSVDPWSAFWAILAAMVGGTGITSYLLLIAVPPTPNCQGILPISTDSERLYCAQVGADTKEVPKLRSAIDLVKGWTDRHPLYGEAQRLLKSWSEDLMRVGRKQLDEGNIDRAIATIKIIPVSSPVYDRAQESIAKWSSQSQTSASIDAKFERSMQLGEWNQAFGTLQSVQRMRGSYWNTYKYDKMSAKLVLERDAWDKLQEAKDALEDKESDSYAERAKRLELAVKAAAIAGKGQVKIVEAPLPQEPEPIVKAMKLANQINPNTYVYQQGQVLRSKWSKHLVQLSVGLYKTQNFNEAIALVQKVPQDVSIYPEAQDWVKLNQAHVWAGKQHMLALMNAVAQVKKIPKTSSIYTLARTKQSNWQGMLKQQTQLQWAKSIASFQQPATLALAIETAKQVPAQSDVGQTIQGEMATWSRQIEIVDNRVILAKARQIVRTGESLANLKAAVRIAGNITIDRPLGAEITTSVAEWTDKIQTIEDRPILTNAIAVASKGNLAQAIEIANKIAPGRALYAHTQAEVRYWRLELQEIADRRTLERAIGIYRQGKISLAIDIASTIARRSSIYNDARSYIADWRLLIPSPIRN